MSAVAGSTAGGAPTRAAADAHRPQGGGPGVERLVPAAAGLPLAHLAWAPAGDAVAQARAPLIVLLHGVGGSRLAWCDRDSGLGSTLAAAGYRVVAPDLPGYGATPAWPAVTLGALAGAVEQLIEALQPPGAAPQAVVLVGHSLGGMLAQEIAARGHLPLAALVLAATSPAFGRPEGDWQQAFLRERFAPLEAGLGMTGLAERLVPQLVGPACPPARMAAARALLAAVPEATYRATVAALVGFDRRASLATITAPTLVLTGEHDRTAAPEVARRMAEKIAAARLAVLPGAGHLANIEDPSAFNTVVVDFLAGLPGLARPAGPALAREAAATESPIARHTA